MIFLESFPIFYSLGLILAIAVSIFSWRFYIFRKNLIKTYLSIPSILVLGAKGSGKTSFIKTFTNSQIESHPIHDGFNFASFNMGEKTIQLIEIPYFVDAIATHLEKIKNMNLICCIYLFDVSKDSEPIEIQIENFKRIRESFKGLKFFALANKVDVADEQKVEKLKKAIGETRLLSITNFLEKEKSAELEKELDDVLSLIKNLSVETFKGKEVSQASKIF
jgi:GTP1/Obg family GTP-binding protein